MAWRPKRLLLMITEIRSGAVALVLLGFLPFDCMQFDQLPDYVPSAKLKLQHEENTQITKK